MTSVSQRGPTTDRLWDLGRWSFWCVCVGVWTAALLTTYPVEVSRRVLPSDFQFPTAKVLHVGAYAFLTVLAARLPVRGRARWLFVAFLSLHGFATEYLQTFIKGRSGSLRDVALDHLGIALGLVLGWRWWRERGPAA
jgi:VanZ family protein